MCVCIYLYTYIYIYICIYACVCVYIYIYILNGPLAGTRWFIRSSERKSAQMCLNESGQRGAALRFSHTCDSTTPMFQRCALSSYALTWLWGWRNPVDFVLFELFNLGEMFTQVLQTGFSACLFSGIGVRIGSPANKERLEEHCRICTVWNLKFDEIVPLCVSRVYQ